MRKLFYFRTRFATIPAHIINLLKAFRVRLNINETEEDIDLIRTFSYPSPSFCKQNGRANLKNKSVFYCADAFETAFAETKPAAGDIGYLSIWEIDCDRHVNYMGFFPTSVPENNIWYKTVVQFQENLVDHAKGLSNEKSE